MTTNDSKSDFIAIGRGRYVFAKDENDRNKVKANQIALEPGQVASIKYVFGVPKDSESWQLTYKGKNSVELKGKEHNGADSEGAERPEVSNDPQKRTAIVMDITGVTSEVTDMQFDCDNFAYFARFDKSNELRVAVLTKTFEIVIPLRILKSIEVKGGNHEVKYQLMEAEKTISGKLVSGDFSGKTDFGSFELPSDKLKQLTFEEAPIFTNQGEVSSYDAILVLKDDTQVPVANLQRYLYTSTNYFTPNDDIRFFRGESLVTVNFADIKTIQFGLQGNVTVILKNGKSATGKRLMPDVEWQEGFHGICDKGEFFIYPKHGKATEFGVKTE